MFRGRIQLAVEEKMYLTHFEKKEMTHLVFKKQDTITTVATSHRRIEEITTLWIAEKKEGKNI